MTRAAGLACLLALWSGAVAAAGNLVLMFDDDCRNWIAVAAPELATVGGRATGYISNECIHRGETNFVDLRRLRDHYRWEIGSHSWHHHDAPRLAGRIGLQAWVQRELDPALAELRGQGIVPRTFAFPFNRYTPELLAAVRSRVGSVRRTSRFPLAAGLAGDGTFPAATLDIWQHEPASQLRAWVDLAAARGVNLYLYAHSIAPDASFFGGTVAEVEAYRIRATGPVSGPATGGDTCLVADLDRRLGKTVKLDRVEGSYVYAAKGDLRQMTAPGARFLTGPCYSTRLSDFRSLLAYARGRLQFATVSESLARKAGNPPIEATGVTGN